MRILLVLGTSTGGVGTHVRALARDLASNDNEVGVISPESTATHFELCSIPGVKFEPCPMSTQIHPRDFSSIRHLSRLIESFGPDVIHAHGFRAALLTLLARRSRRAWAPVVVSWHNQASARGVRARVETAIEAFLARSADLTLGASEDLAARARQVGAPDAVFAPVAAPQSPVPNPHVVVELRQKYLSGSPGDMLLGLAVGRVAPQKNYDLLVDALQQTSRPVHILIAGATDEAVQADLQSRIDAEGLGRSHLTFLGPRHDIAGLMAAADFYVLTSHWEARALVLQEALRARLPIVATNTGGTPGLVGHAGALINPSDFDAAQQFAQVFNELSDSETRHDYAQASADRARELPDEAEVTEILTRHYEQVLRAGP